MNTLAIINKRHKSNTVILILDQKILLELFITIKITHFLQEDF